MCVVFSTEPSWLELAKHDSGEYNNIPPCEILVGPLGNILSQVWSGNNISLNPPPAPALPGRGQRRGISPDIISCHINPGQGTVIVTFSLLSSHFQGNVGCRTSCLSWLLTHDRTVLFCNGREWHWSHDSSEYLPASPSFKSSNFLLFFLEICSTFPILREAGTRKLKQKCSLSSFR